MKPIISNARIPVRPPTAIPRPKPVVNEAQIKQDRFNAQLRAIQQNAPAPAIPEEIQRVKEVEGRTLPVQSAIPAPVGERLKKRNLKRKPKSGTKRS